MKMDDRCEFNNGCCTMLLPVFKPVSSRNQRCECCHDLCETGLKPVLIKERLKGQFVRDDDPAANVAAKTMTELGLDVLYPAFTNLTCLRRLLSTPPIKRTLIQWNGFLDNSTASSLRNLELTRSGYISSHCMLTFFYCSQVILAICFNLHVQGCIVFQSNFQNVFQNFQIFILTFGRARFRKIYGKFINLIQIMLMRIICFCGTIFSLHHIERERMGGFTIGILLENCTDLDLEIPLRTLNTDTSFIMSSS